MRQATRRLRRVGLRSHLKAPELRLHRPCWGRSGGAGTDTPRKVGKNSGAEVNIGVFRVEAVRAGSAHWPPAPGRPVRPAAAASPPRRPLQFFQQPSPPGTHPRRGGFTCASAGRRAFRAVRAVQGGHDRGGRRGPSDTGGGARTSTTVLGSTAGMTRCRLCLSPALRHGRHRLAGPVPRGPASSGLTHDAGRDQAACPSISLTSSGHSGGENRWPIWCTNTNLTGFAARWLTQAASAHHTAGSPPHARSQAARPAA